MPLLCCILLAASLIATEANVNGRSETPYRAVGSIPIGGEGFWDIVTIDPASHRLYLSHATKVVVIDLQKGSVVGEITDTPGVHAFLAIPELKRGFSTNGRENKASIVDLTNLHTIKKVACGESPDDLVYDSVHGEVYIFNHKGNSATVVNAETGAVTHTIPLGGSPEFAVVDGAQNRIYCNLEDKSEAIAIDTAKHEVVAHWSLGPGEEPTGIALDAAHHRLFSTCHNQLLTMLDTQNGKVVATAAIGRGVDGCAFDPSSQLVFASCGEGVVTIAKEESPERLEVVQTLSTQRSARTIALDPNTHRLYLPAAQLEPAPSPSPGSSPARPRIVPGTLRLLVYGRKK